MLWPVMEAHMIGQQVVSESSTSTNGCYASARFDDSLQSLPSPQEPHPRRRSERALLIENAISQLLQSGSPHPPQIFVADMHNSRDAVFEKRLKHHKYSQGTNHKHQQMRMMNPKLDVWLIPALSICFIDVYFVSAALVVKYSSRTTVPGLAITLSFLPALLEGAFRHAESGLETEDLDRSVALSARVIVGLESVCQNIMPGNLLDL